MFAAHSPLAPPEDYSPDPTLTPQQHRIVTRLASGLSISQAAGAEKIHRNTIGNWRRTIPAFARELEYANRERCLYWHEQAIALVPLALATISETLSDTEASPALKFRAALAILKMSTAYEPKQLLYHEAVESQLEAAAGQVLSWRKADLENTHNSAQSCTTPTAPARPQPIRVAPQPGRNAPCPCGSGLKYKRCCANKPPLRLPCNGIVS
jgi:transposase-like protein